MLEEALKNQEKALIELQKSTNNYENSIKEAINKVDGKDKIALQNLQNEIKQVLLLAKKGANVDNLVQNIIKKHGGSNNK